MKNELKDMYNVDWNNDNIYIKSKFVSSDLINHIFECYYPEKIVFDEDNVREFGRGAFAGVNMGIVDLTSAKNLEVIGEKCFMGAYNMDCNHAFENVIYLGKHSFYKACVIGEISLPKVREVPKGAFEDVNAYSIKITGASSIDETAFKGAIVEARIERGNSQDILKNAILL